jgi:hypothetical protein
MSVYVGTNDVATGSYGDTDRDIEEFVRVLSDNGYVVVRDSDRPWNHNMIGLGAGHNDAKFAESTSQTVEMRSSHSMAAYYESGDAYDGYWWENRTGIKYYGATRDEYSTCEAHARHDYLWLVGASHDDCPYEYCTS